MDETQLLLFGLASLFVLGIGAQWLAWRLGVPSVVMLLLVGFAAGPGTGLLDPEQILGELLFPFVSISVAVILFEGGLSLKLGELRDIGRVLRNLVTVGALLTWLLATLGAWLLLEMDFPIALLLGAILVVTGPTVIGPMLRHIRPTGAVAPVAKWEGIIIDPIGAILAVLVFEAIETGEAGTVAHVTGGALASLARTALAGGVLALLGTVPLILLLRRYWIPDYLQSPVTLALAVGAFAASNSFQHESGLVTVTLMGIILANQRSVTVRHIMQFKEDLSVLLISVLFILLAARVEVGDVTSLGWQSTLFVVYLILVVRPAAVLLCAAGSSLTWSERLFLSSLAPRGIVAAAVSSIFAFRLGPAGEGLVPVTFLVIVSTVVIYGLAAPLLARRLELAPKNPQGVLFAGAYAGARAVAHALVEHDIPVLLVDTNRTDLRRARLEGLPTYYGSIVSERAMDEMDLGGMGRLLAVTRNDEVNSLAALHFSEVFGRAEVYQLAPREVPKVRADSTPSHLRGRVLFGKRVSYDNLEQRFARGQTVKATPLTVEFDYAAFRTYYGDEALPLFAVRDGQLTVYTAERRPSPKPGTTLISLVSEAADDEAG